MVSLTEKLSSFPIAVKGIKLQGNHAGYAAWDPEESVSELAHVGEEWAFPGHSVGDHTHPHHEFHLQLTGQTKWIVRDEACDVGAGSLIGVSPKVRHSMTVSGRHANHYIYCSIDIGSLFRRLGLPKGDSAFLGRYFKIDDAEPFHEAFQILSREITRKDKHRAGLIRTATEAIGYLLDRYCTQEAPQKREPVLQDLVVSRVKEYCEEHLAEKLCVETMAKSIGVSRSHLFNILKEKLGVSPFAYHADLRMQRACQMLKMDYLPLTTIAHELGFGSSQHFSTAFKKRYGLSPLRARRSFQ